MGVDLGMTGGTAVMIGPALAHAAPMPVRDKALDLAAIRDLLELWRPERVTIEHPVPVRRGAGNGVDSGYTSTMHQLGQWQGLCAALDLPVVTVYPREWQVVHAGLPGDTKERAVAFCKRFYPGVDLRPGRRTKDAEGIADAVGVCEWGRRSFGLPSPGETA